MAWTDDDEMELELLALEQEAAEQEKAGPPPVAEPGSPLEAALKEQTGPVVTVQTPTGPVRLTREGKPFMEASEFGEQVAARGRQRDLERLLSVTSGSPFFGKAAGVRAGFEALAGGRPILPAYEKGREQALQAAQEATAAVSPTVPVPYLGRVPVLPAVGGALSTGFAGAAPTAAGRIGLSALLGATQATDVGKARLTQGEFAEAAKEAGIGGLVGAAGGAVAEVPGAALRGMEALGARLRGTGERWATQKGLEAAAKTTATMRSEAGRAGSDLARQAEKIQFIMEKGPGGAPGVTQEVYDAALLEAQRPEIAAELAQQYTNYVENIAPSAAKRAATRAEYVKAMETEPSRAAQYTEEILADPLASTAQRAKRAATRYAVAKVGGVLGGEAGLASSAAPGNVQMLYNMMKDPGVALAAGRALESTAGLAGDVTRFGAPAVTLQSLSGADAVKARQNGFDALMRRFGIVAESPDEAANQAYLLGQTRPDAQPGRR